MKIFYINLDRCQDKNEHMKKTFPEAIRFSGVDGRQENSSTINYKADRNWRDPNWNRRLTQGEVGCVLSHLKLWKKCVELNESILILEDDVIPLVDNWKQKLENYSNYDLLYAGRKYIEGEKIEINEELETPGFSYWCSSYMISPKFANALVSFFDNTEIRLIILKNIN